MNKMYNAIKTELEWHSNREVPTPEYHCYYFMICDLFGEQYLADAHFENDVFVYFTERDENFWELKDITCWTMLPSSTTLMELFTDDNITDCACGDTTPHEPWEPECGLGKSEEHVGFGTTYFDKVDGAMKLLNKIYENLEEEEPEESFIVANMAQCALCKDVIESHSRHDFVSCSCGSVAVDGGMDYLRRIGERENIIELSVYSTDSYETIRTHFKRGSRGVNGDEPLTWIPLEQMTNAHLRATIAYENPNNKFIPLYEQELEYRGEWE